jgi:hypothetical protein
LRPRARAVSATGAKRASDWAIEQLMLFSEKVSEAAPKIAISSAPAARAASRPRALGTRTG